MGLDFMLSSVRLSITSKKILSFMLMLAKNPFRTIHKHPFALSVQKIIRNKQKIWKLWMSVLRYSTKSFTTPWEPVTLFSGFMLMLAKNPFGTIHKHPFALSVQKIIITSKKKLSFMLMLAKNPFRSIYKHPFALSVPNCIIQIQKKPKKVMNIYSQLSIKSNPLGSVP
jgi:hypothetical protein